MPLLELGGIKITRYLLHLRDYTFVRDGWSSLNEAPTRSRVACAAAGGYFRRTNGVQARTDATRIACPDHVCNPETPFTAHSGAGSVDERNSEGGWSRRRRDDDATAPQRRRNGVAKRCRRTKHGASSHPAARRLLAGLLLRVQWVFPPGAAELVRPCFEAPPRRSRSTRVWKPK